VLTSAYIHRPPVRPEGCAGGRCSVPGAVLFWQVASVRARRV